MATATSTDRPTKAAFMDFLLLEGVLNVSDKPGMRQVSMLGIGLGQISVFGQGWGYNVKGRDYFFPSKELAAQARAKRIFTYNEYNFYPLLISAWDALDKAAQEDLLARRRSLLQRKKELSHV